MTRRPVVALVILAAAGVGLALRGANLNLRPMHGDEAVHAVKFDELWRTGRYVYDSYEYHGPTLYYATLPVRWLSGAGSFADTDAALYRIVPALCGVGLILLVWLVRDGLGRAAAACAAVLTALSPAQVFYSRYYIQEMLLAFFTFLTIAAGWRYACTRRRRWALLAGAGVGLMHATKETCIIAYGCLAVSLLVAILWQRTPNLSPERERRVVESATGTPRKFGWRIPIAAALLAILVSATFYSGFFTNLRGPLDSLRAYGAYVNRAAGHVWHIHEWWYYLDLLALRHHPHSPRWTEGLILVLGTIGIGAARRGRGLADGQLAFVRFIAVYAVLMTAAYSAIPYKTPWCVVQFLHPLILLAGVGAVALVRGLRLTALRAVAVVALVLATVQLGGQACLANFRYYADQRNPYVYAHPVTDVENLATWIGRLADVHPDGRKMLVKVIVPNPWPLPWYLRGFSCVGYWETPPADCDAPVIIVSDDLQRAVAARLNGDYQVSSYGLRPDVGRVLVYVELGLYEAFAARQGGTASQPSEETP